MSTYKREFIATTSGSIGIDSGSIGVDLTTITNRLNTLVSKPLALPQIEKSLTTVSGNFYQITAATPVFAGTAGMSANTVVGFADEVTGASGSPLTVTKITSDAAGLVSVVGQGYVLNPYIWFSENVPSKVISLYYGISSTLGGLSETAFLIEPMKFAEIQADTEAFIAQIKGTAYDSAVAPAKNLTGLDSRLSLLESGAGAPGQEKEFGIAPEFANMVFDASGLPNSNGTWLGGIETDGTVLHTCLDWSTNVATDQSYRIRVMVKLPGDFGAWHGSHPVKIWAKGVGSSANIGLKISINDVSGTVTNINDRPIIFDGTNMNQWRAHTMPAITGGTFTKNQWFCLTLEAKANNIGNTVKIGKIDFSYLTA